MSVDIWPILLSIPGTLMSVWMCLRWLVPLPSRRASSPLSPNTLNVGQTIPTSSSIVDIVARGVGSFPNNHTPNQSFASIQRNFSHQ